MGSLSRQRGHGYEREVAEKLRCVFPEAMRLLEYQVQDCNGVDLKHTGNLLIQIKRGRNYAPINKIEEIKPSGKINCLITRADRKKDVICLYLDDFIKIIKDVGVVYP